MFIAMLVQHSYNSSIKGWISLTHALTLSSTDARIKILFDKNRNRDFRIISRCARLPTRPLTRRGLRLCICIVIVVVSRTQRIGGQPEKTTLDIVANHTCGLLNRGKRTKIEQKEKVWQSTPPSLCRCSGGNKI